MHQWLACSITSLQVHHFDAQEGGALVLRQSGQLASGGSVHIYSADMRRQVCLQCLPSQMRYRP